MVATDELPFKTALIEIACGHKYSKLASSSTKILDLQHQFEPKPRQGPEPEPEQALRVGVCFNARQLPGCHNLIEGLCELGFRVFGFLGGTEGLFNNRAIEITAEKLEFFRNVGGMHMLGRDKDKLRDAEELGRATATVEALELDGLVLVGATHTLTDVLILSEHLLK